MRWGIGGLVLLAFLGEAVTQSCPKESVFRAATFLVAPETVADKPEKYLGHVSLPGWQWDHKPDVQSTDDSWTATMFFHRDKRVSGHMNNCCHVLWVFWCTCDCEDDLVEGRFAVEATFQLTAPTPETSLMVSPGHWSCTRKTKNCETLSDWHCDQPSPSEMQSFAAEVKQQLRRNMGILSQGSATHWRQAQLPFLGAATLWYRWEQARGSEFSGRLRATVETCVEVDGRFYNAGDDNSATGRTTRKWQPVGSQSFTTAAPLSLSLKTGKENTWDVNVVSVPAGLQLKLTQTCGCTSRLPSWSPWQPSFLCKPGCSMQVACPTIDGSDGRQNLNYGKPVTSLHVSERAGKLQISTNGGGSLVSCSIPAASSREWSVELNPDGAWKQEKEVHSWGGMPEEWPEEASEGARVSSALLLAAIWAKNQSQVLLQSTENSQILDGVVAQNVTAKHSRFDVVQGEAAGDIPAFLSFSITGAQVNVQCHSADTSGKAGTAGEPLLAAEIGQLEGRAFCSAHRAGDEIEVAFSMNLSHVKMIKPQLIVPSLPIQQAKLEDFLELHLRGLQSKLAPNMKSWRIPSDIAKFLPCDYGGSGGCGHLHGAHDGSLVYMEFLRRTRAGSAIALLDLSTAASGDSGEACPTGRVAWLVDEAVLILRFAFGHLKQFFFDCLSVTGMDVSVAGCILSLVCILLGCIPLRAWLSDGQEASYSASWWLAALQASHAVAWTVASPFATFTVQKLNDLGILSVGGLASSEVMASFENLATDGFTVSIVGVVAFCISARAKDPIVQLSASVIMLIFHCSTIVAWPMSNFVGKLVAENAHDGESAGTALDLLLTFLNVTNQQAVDMKTAAINASFTSLWVGLLGIYCIFLLQGLAAGLTAGVLAFCARSALNIQRNGTHMALAVSALVEIIVLASLLVPLTTAHQLLNHLGQSCWLCLLLMCCARFMMVFMASRVDASVPPVIVSHVVQSAIGCFYMWQLLSDSLSTSTVYSDGALSSMLSLQGTFVLTMSATAAGLSAIAMAMAVECQAKGQQKTLWQTSIVIQKLVSTLLLCKHQAIELAARTFGTVMSSPEDSQRRLRSVGQTVSDFFRFLGVKVESSLARLAAFDIEEIICRYLCPGVCRVLLVEVITTWIWHLEKIALLLMVPQWLFLVPWMGLLDMILVGLAALTCYCCRLEFHDLATAARRFLVDSSRSIADIAICVHRRLSGQQPSAVGSLAQPLIGGDERSSEVPSIRTRFARRVAGTSVWEQLSTNPGLSCLLRSTIHLNTMMQALVRDLFPADVQAVDEREEHSIAACMPYRQELLQLGFAHWILVWFREQIHLRGPFHSFESMFWQSRADVLDKFHGWLETHNFDVINKETMVDNAYMSWYHLQLGSLLTSLAGLVCLGFAAFHKQLGRMMGSQCLTTIAWSQRTAFTAAVLGILAVFLPFLPNYAERVLAAHRLPSCAPEFDQYARFISHGVAGTGFAAKLSSEAFAVLFLLPVSATRALWLPMIKFNPDWTAEPAPRSDLLDILSGLLQILAYTSPLVTCFPLLYYNQLAMDSSAQGPMLVFWLCPMILMGMFYKHHRRVYFYPAWLACYCMTFAWFAQTQVQKLGLDWWELFTNVDWPWALSAMHVDFCLVNVIVGDLIYILLGEAALRVPAEDPAMDADHVEAEGPVPMHGGRGEDVEAPDHEDGPRPEAAE